MMTRLCFHAALIAGLTGVCLQAHEVPRPSVNDVTSAVLDRLAVASAETRAAAETAEGMLSFLSTGESNVLATAHLRFHVDGPVQLTVFRDARQTNEPFWLEARDFRATGARLKVGRYEFEGWERAFGAGEIGLGISSLRGGGLHYLLAIRPLQARGKVRVGSLQPQELRVGAWASGVLPYVDRDDAAGELPVGLEGQILLRTEHRRRDDGRLVKVLRQTSYASSERPDSVVLTWSGDPRTTQAIQWRTSPRVSLGWVEFWPVDEHAAGASRVTRVPARLELLVDKRLVEDREIHWHTAELSGLTPGTQYGYRVGGAEGVGCSEPATFSTAPGGSEPFAFYYLGDAQTGLDQWGSLIHRALRDRPDAAFFLIAGDLVNRGQERDDWDAFFHHAQGVLDRRPLVPVIGNHDCQGGHPTLYLKQFSLPHNGPSTIEAERAYAFEYGAGLFVILDSNLDPKQQRPWLETQLARSRARWKLVAFHHPVYSSAPRRDNAALRKAWTPLFDKHQVDLVLQGHDHAYLRTYPMKGHRRLSDPARGTTYVVSVSGSKLYDQAEREETAVGFTKVSTYQVLDVQAAGNRLVYRAHDAQGRLRDEFVLEK